MSSFFSSSIRTAIGYSGSSIIAIRFTQASYTCTIREYIRAMQTLGRNIVENFNTACVANDNFAYEECQVVFHSAIIYSI
jgi:hypothetical protein